MRDNYFTTIFSGNSLTLVSHYPPFPRTFSSPLYMFICLIIHYLLIGKIFSSIVFGILCHGNMDKIKLKYIVFQKNVLNECEVEFQVCTYILTIPCKTSYLGITEIIQELSNCLTHDHLSLVCGTPYVHDQRVTNLHEVIPEIARGPGKHCWVGSKTRIPMSQSDFCTFFILLSPGKFQVHLPEFKLQHLYLHTHTFTHKHTKYSLQLLVLNLVRFLLQSNKYISS